MVPVGFFYAASGLLVPGPWLYLMWLLYLALLGLAVWLARRGSYVVLAVPVVAAVPGRHHQPRRDLLGLDRLTPQVTPPRCRSRP